MLDLDHQNSGDSQEFRQVAGLQRTCHQADRRKRRGVVKAKRAAGSGNFIDAATRVVGDRDRNIKPAHSSAPTPDF